MSNHQDESTVPLTGGSEDTGSMSASVRSSGSLLERIQAQRRMQQGNPVPPPNTPQQIRIPQYNPVPSDPSANFATDSSSNGNFLSSAWNNLNENVEQGMATMSTTVFASDSVSRDALLSSPPQQREGGGLPTSPSGVNRDYSMSDYFTTCVSDAYDAFQQLHVIARWVVCLVLLYIALRLL